MESPIFKSWNKKLTTIDIVYPNKYYAGVYCLAPLIFYNIINSLKDFYCNRIFLDKNKITSNLLAFTFQYELDYFNFFKILKTNNIPIKKENRKQIIFAGGPCINLNIKPLQPYIDFFIQGEIEEILPKILKIYKKHPNKETFLNKIKKYTNKHNTITNLDNIPYPIYQPFPEKIDKQFVFGKAFLLEIERGCPFKCHFCALSAIYKKVKTRSLSQIKEIIDKAIKINKRNKVIIYSPSFSHPKRKEILKHLISKNLQFSVPSIKIEFIDDELLSLIKKGGQKTLTIAPEANERLRHKINKFVSDKDFFEFIKKAKSHNFKLKLYFMIGLPEQTKKDLDEMIKFINKANCPVSINAFIPKPLTYFHKHKFNKKIIKTQTNYLKKNLKVKFKLAPIKNSLLEYKLANQTSFLQYNQ